ncbi:unnamed protein product, partial [Urochloa humidicola]
FPVRSRGGADSGGKRHQPTALRFTDGHRLHCTASPDFIYTDEIHPLLPKSLMIKELHAFFEGRIE